MENLAMSRGRDNRQPKLLSSAVPPRRGTQATTESEFIATSTTASTTADPRPMPTAPGSQPSVDNTHRLAPQVKFKTSKVRKLTLALLESKLTNVKYEPLNCKMLGQEIAANIMDEVKALNMQRYKVVSIVSIGSNMEKPGMQFGSRCLWDATTDSFVNVKYTNQTLFAVALVFGLYYG